MKVYIYTCSENSAINVYRFVTIKLSIFDFIDSITWIFLPDNIDDQIMYVFKVKTKVFPGNCKSSCHEITLHKIKLIKQYLSFEINTFADHGYVGHFFMVGKKFITINK